MRDYLKLDEIKYILESHLDDEDAGYIYSAVLQEADTCLCAARCAPECCCGAWDDEEYDDAMEFTNNDCLEWDE